MYIFSNFPHLGVLLNFRIGEKVVIASFITDFKFKTLLLNMLFMDYSASVSHGRGACQKCHILDPTPGQLHPSLPSGSCASKQVRSATFSSSFFYIEFLNTSSSNGQCCRVLNAQQASMYNLVLASILSKPTICLKAFFCIG